MQRALRKHNFHAIINNEFGCRVSHTFRCISFARSEHTMVVVSRWWGLGRSPSRCARTKSSQNHPVNSFVWVNCHTIVHICVCSGGKLQRLCAKIIVAPCVAISWVKGPCWIRWSIPIDNENVFAKPCFAVSRVQNRKFAYNQQSPKNSIQHRPIINYSLRQGT